MGGRVKVGALKKFLTDPAAAKPGTTMPNVFAGDPDKAAKVEALTHVLASTGTLRQERPDLKGILVGRDLYQKVGCVACHGPRDLAGLALKAPPSAVPLGNVKGKYSIPSLAAFLEHPHTVRPGGRMPQLVTAKEAKEIANYLLQGVKIDLPEARGSTTFAYYEGTWDKLPEFGKLKPARTGSAPAFELGVAKREHNYAIKFEGYFKTERAGRYRFTLSSDDGSRLDIDGNQVVDNDGIHPVTAAHGSATLSKGIHKVAVTFFQAAGEAVLDVQVEEPGAAIQPLAAFVAATETGLDTSPAQPKANPDDAITIDSGLVTKGKALFASAGCANCHQMNLDKKLIAPAVTAPALASLKPGGGCLAESPHGVPQYSLNAAQRGALAAAIKSPPAPPKEPAAVIANAMTTFNCFACHVRDKVGGPLEELNPLFLTSQPEMGDEGRVPPPLDGVGNKLNLDYFKQIIDKGSHDRPYMHTRMPGFGMANVGPVVEAFVAADKAAAVPAVTFHTTDAKVKAAGRFLVGAQALSCFKCHTFAGQKAEGVQGIDMVLMTKRVQRDWFQRYLLDPQQVRPGTRMPGSWPDGKTFYKDLLEGQTDAQIEAIWVYLKDPAQAPIGLGKQSIPLTPTTGAILYRNFIQGAGTRAIAIGYPEKVSLAFDANDLRLAMIWQGAFIDAAKHWTDRGVGFEGPLGDNILKLPSGPAFAVLPTSEAAWPGGSAKDLGQKFLGYRLTADDRPTFRYSLGTATVEDFPAPTAGKEPGLQRTLTVTGTPADGLTFRAAVGTKIEAASDGWYKVDGWKLKIDGANARVRSSGGKSELLVPMAGATKITLEYVW